MRMVSLIYIFFICTLLNKFRISILFNEHSGEKKTEFRLRSQNQTWTEIFLSQKCINRFFGSLFRELVGKLKSCVKENNSQNV